MSFSNLEELVLTVRDPSSRGYIEEAIRAYHAGAYRSAIVATWTAVAYDLIQKFREMGSGGEVAARNFIDKFDDARGRNSIPELLVYEYGLIELAASSDFEMLQSHEVVLLERLKTRS
jgi:hypothetical protein